MKYSFREYGTEEIRIIQSNKPIIVLSHVIWAELLPGVISMVIDKPFVIEEKDEKFVVI